MAHKTQIIGLALLICTLLFGGCNTSRKGVKAHPPRFDEDEKTPAEQTKAKLLKQIDRKFENPNAHFELGRLYQADGAWAQAEQEYKTALNFDPAHRQAQAARIKVLMAIGDKTKAELLADEYISQASNSAAGSLELASAFQKQKLDEYAVVCYRRALHLAPNSAKVNRRFGYYYLSRNDTVSAEEYLSRSFDLDWNQPDVAAELGLLGVTIEIPPKARKSTSFLDTIAGLFKKKPKP